MLKNKVNAYQKIVAILLIVLSFSACQKKQVASSVDPADFFNIVYRATAVRDIGATTWQPVQGSFQVQFSQSSATSGTYKMIYTSYLEPQFCPYGQNCVCSGGIQGSYATPGDPEVSTPQPYNPMDAYSAPGGSGTTVDPTAQIDPSTGLPVVSKIYTFLFNISIDIKSMSSGCKPEADRQIKIVRFSNGAAIMTNDYREQYIVPVVIPQN